MGFSRRRVTSRIELTLAGGETKDGDAIAMANFEGVEYQIKLATVLSDQIKLMKVRAVGNSTAVSDTLYSVIGDALDVDIKVIVDGADMVLRCVNNEAFSINVTILKTIV